MIATSLQFTPSAIVALDDCFCPGGINFWDKHPINLWQRHQHCTLLHCALSNKNALEVGVACRWHNAGHQK